jgi:hypothetical protein
MLSVTVQRVAAENRLVELVRGSGRVVGAVDVGVVARRLRFSPPERSRQLRLMLAVVTVVGDFRGNRDLSSANRAAS